MKTSSLFMAGLLAFGGTAANAQDDELLGLWGSEISFAPALQGELTLQRAGQTWRARIAGAAAECQVEADSMRCPFSQNRGYYRGSLMKGEPVSGWWVRPSGETED